jgi:uncharacterized membrane protein YGL010W
MALVPTLDLLSRFKDYESSHQTPGNRWTHWVGIPAVVFSILGLFSRVQLHFSGVSTDLGQVAIGLAVLWTLKVDWKIAVPFGLSLTAQYFVAKEVPLGFLIGIQAVGWIFQLYGHAKYEKKRPKFLESAQHLLVGPLWKFVTLIGYYTPPRAKSRARK